MISNGSTILKSDLDGAFSSSIAALRAAKAAGVAAAGVYQLPFDWPLLVDAGTAVTGDRLSQSFTIPDDDQELLAIGARIEGAAGTYGLRLTGPLVSPIVLEEVTTSSSANLERYLGNDDGQPLQMLLRGATYTLHVSTDVASGDVTVRAWLLLRLRPRKR